MAANDAVWLCLFLVVQVSFPYSKSEKVSMRLVDEPSNFGYNQDSLQQPSSLVAKVKPANVSGPVLLRRLAGHCIEEVEGQYKYMFCPFHNLTQHEQSLRWNPYSGILGIWQEWLIGNNTFKAMLLKSGDACGERNRQATVFFKCNTENKLTEISEPQTCQYEMTFQTPLVCHPHSMLVYPILSEELRDKWDKLEGELQEEEITEQGYNKSLHTIFEEAGFVLPPDKTLTPVKNEDEARETKSFSDLETCSEEYNKLVEEVNRLRELIPEDTKKEVGE
ncbi:N-acetylglucosamine-1-phosphotransferase subunit gamma-like isoform X2 [Ptychodera flava]|uniref:N-acetylglucosamine-1-phosphotransferase subunit gamma-like isoform X2 n=1 Tax=Ptychodera flava TaxID=63121 RepID=UPI00396A0D47